MRGRARSSPTGFCRCADSWCHAENGLSRLIWAHDHHMVYQAVRPWMTTRRSDARPGAEIPGTAEPQAGLATGASH
jgi:hypothetical protein